MSVYTLSVLAIVMAVGCALLSWAITSWEPADRQWLLERVRKGAAAYRQLFDRIAHRLTVRLRMQDDQTATLGDVSEMIDVVRLGLSAGLSFDASLELYGTQRNTKLAALLNRALMDWSVGAGTREEELTRVAQVTDIKALESFAAAVSQALMLGAPLSDVLASQEREIRQAHRARIERAIEKAPVKLLIPTGTLILPALLLSILGPLLAASGML